MARDAIDDADALRSHHSSRALHHVCVDACVDASPDASVDASNIAVINQEVDEIEHCSRDGIENSCGQMRMRVKNKLLFSCSISLINRSRSTTELTTDSKRKQDIVGDETPKSIKTLTSCGFVPAKNEVVKISKRCSVFKQRDFLQQTFSSNAGFTPAFFMRASHLLRDARRAEFISVSGQCAARSAHNSDLRNHKRSSGGVAATEHLRAPMNSPMDRLWHPAGFLLNYALIQ